MNEQIKNTLERIVALEPFNIEMRDFSGHNECGTCYCIAGRLAEIDKQAQEATITNYGYLSYTREHLGIDANLVLWDWLFSSGWPDSLTEAKVRAKFVLVNGRLPSTFVDSINAELEYTYGSVNESGQPLSTAIDEENSDEDSGLAAVKEYVSTGYYSRMIYDFWGKYPELNAELNDE